MDDTLSIQVLRKDFKEPLERALRYYSMISVWNNLNLSQRQIQLLAHTAVRGTISSLSSKEEFCKLFGSSPATVNNMISELSSIGLLVKVQGKYKVNKAIDLDFSKDLILVFKLFGSQEGRK